MLTFKNHDTNDNYALPSRTLVGVHACIARILDATGMGKKFDRILRDREELFCLSSTGDTDLGSLSLLLLAC
jgi:hypothetical protein